MTGLLILFGIAAGLIFVVGTTALLYGLTHPRRKTYAVALAAGHPTDPAELEMTAEEATFSLSDGAATSGWLIRGGREVGPTVVIVHGFGDSRYGAMACWTPLVLPFASSVVVYDQRGQGESQTKAGGLGVREVDDLLSVLDQLPSDGPVVLFGYSLGAGVAIATAARAGGRVAGVIADGPYRQWDAPVRRMLRMRSYPTQPFLFLAGLILRLTVRGIGDYDRVAHARKLSCPLLVLHGTADELCDFAAGRAIAEAAPHGQLVAFEGGGHLNLFELDRPRYDDALRQFFSNLDDRVQ